MLSQEEINALIAGGSTDESDANSGSVPASSLSDEEKDALGEIGNISMGTAATTLFTLLNQKVTITTPRVTEVTVGEVLSRFVDPCVTIDVRYTVGIQGSNLMVLKAKDVKVITDLMLGGDGTNIADELNEMHLSAISEAMNQMIGSSSTSLSEMVGKMIDISPPIAYDKPIGDVLAELQSFEADEVVVLIAFDMKVGDLVDSEIMQMMPLDMARSLLSSMMGGNDDDDIDEVVSSSAPAPSAPVQSAPKSSPSIQQQKPAQPVDARPVQFEAFDNRVDLTHLSSEIGLIKEVPLEISVELGRTVKKISEILDFGTGTIIELDTIVGEPLNILANGKKVAKGEVVVIEENYGVRITEIIIPEKL